MHNWLATVDVRTKDFVAVQKRRFSTGCSCLAVDIAVNGIYLCMCPKLVHTAASLLTLLGVRACLRHDSFIEQTTRQDPGSSAASISQIKNAQTTKDSNARDIVQEYLPCVSINQFDDFPSLQSKSNQAYMCLHWVSKESSTECEQNLPKLYGSTVIRSWTNPEFTVLPKGLTEHGGRSKNPPLANSMVKHKVHE